MTFVIPGWFFWLVGIIVWLACGVLAYGHMLAVFQRGYPSVAERDYKGDRITALSASIFGPIGLVASLLISHGHGFMYFRPWKPTMNDFLRDADRQK